MPGNSQKEIRMQWRQDIPLDLPFTVPALRDSLFNLMEPAILSGDLQLLPHAVEIGSRYNPLSLAALRRFNQPVEEVLLSDVVYKVRKPEAFIGDPKVRMYSQGVPGDNRALYPFLESQPSSLYFENILNYLGVRAAGNLIARASQVVVINNYLAGFLLEQNYRARTLPTELQEDLSKAGFTPIVERAATFCLVGVYERK